MTRIKKARVSKALLHLVFFLSGIATVLIGQVLPILGRHFSLSDLRLSYFFPAQFAGSLCGTLLTSRFARNHDHMSAAVIGGVSMALGVLVINADSFALCLVGFFINGIGIGLTLPAINMMILEAEPARSASALSILNFCWGVGAIVCKPFVDILSTPGNIALTTLILAALLLASSISILFTMPAGQDTAGRSVTHDGGPLSIWRMPMAWAIGLFNFIHVGFESGMGGWLTTYTGRLQGEPLLSWVSPTLLYFVFFVAGRAVAPILFRYLDEKKMLFLGLGIVLAGTIVTLSAASVVMLSLGAVIAGFGTSWIFPANVSRFFNTFGPAATRQAAPLFLCGTLGAATVTWLIGFLSSRTNDLRSGMYVLIVSVALLIVLQIALSARKTASIADRR